MWRNWLILLVAAGALRADLAVTFLPQQLVFATSHEGTTFAISAPQAFEVVNVWPLTLTDRATGRPVPLAALSLQERKIGDANGRLHEFTARVDAKALSLNVAFDGVLAIAYKAADQQGFSTAAFQIVRDGFNPAVDKPEATTLSVVEGPTKLALDSTDSFQVCLAAEKGAVAVERVVVAALSENPSGRIYDVKAIQLSTLPRLITPAAMGCFKGALLPRLPSDSFKVSVVFNIVYRAAGPGGPWKSLPWTIEFSKPAPELRFGVNGEATLPLTRYQPFAPTEEFSPPCVDYRTSPSDALLPPDTPLRSSLTTNTPQKAVYPGGAELVSKTSGGKICFTARIPRGLTSLRGKVLVLPPFVGKETELNPVFPVKDAWFYRLIAVVVAYGLALLLQWGTTHTRRTMLHNGMRRNLSDRLSRFLTARPDLANHDSVALAQQLLTDSVSLDRAGEFDLAEQNLQSAASRINDLITNPPSASTPLATGTEDIRIVQNAPQQQAGKVLTMIAAKPADLKLPATIRWDVIDPSGKTVRTEMGPNRLSLRYRFEKAGTYTVRVTVPGVAPFTRTVTISDPPKKDSLAGLKDLDLLTQGVAFLLACATAYATTNSADAWGTMTDYVTLIGTAFGVGAGAQGIRLVIQAVRGT
ncbi:MAG TPA: hypothetical protein VGN17_26600 [Bryobacteraceae bacterium]|jgi:hypothetical protein